MQNNKTFRTFRRRKKYIIKYVLTNRTKPTETV